MPHADEDAQPEPFALPSFHDQILGRVADADAEVAREARGLTQYPIVARIESDLQAAVRDAEAARADPAKARTAEAAPPGSGYLGTIEAKIRAILLVAETACVSVEKVCEAFGWPVPPFITTVHKALDAILDVDHGPEPAFEGEPGAGKKAARKK